MTKTYVDENGILRQVPKPPKPTDNLDLFEADHIASASRNAAGTKPSEMADNLGVTARRDGPNKTKGKT